MYAEAHLVTVMMIICLIVYSYVSILFSSLLNSSCQCEAKSINRVISYL